MIKIIALTLAIFGCVVIPKKYPTAYTHPSKPVESLSADRYDCENMAKEMASRGTLNLMVAGNPLEAETARCLQNKHGWVPVK